MLKNTGSRSHWWWVRHWHDDCHCVRTERRQGLHRVSQGEATQGGARAATLISDTVYAFPAPNVCPPPTQVSEKLNQISPGSCEYVVADLSVSPRLSASASFDGNA